MLLQTIVAMSMRLSPVSAEHVAVAVAVDVAVKVNVNAHVGALWT